MTFVFGARHNLRGNLPPRFWFHCAGRAPLDRTLSSPLPQEVWWRGLLHWYISCSKAKAASFDDSVVSATLDYAGRESARREIDSIDGTVTLVMLGDTFGKLWFGVSHKDAAKT